MAIGKIRFIQRRKSPMYLDYWVGGKVSSAGFQRTLATIYFLIRLLWLATHSHLPSWKTQVSVKRPKCS